MASPSLLPPLRRAPAAVHGRLLSTSASLGRTSDTFMYRVVLNNKRHLPQHKRQLMRPFETPNDYPDIPIHKYGCRGTGVRHQAAWQAVPEMVPELVVPDLSDFSLKPYVSYRTKEIYQDELTSKDLFNAVYGKKILLDFKEGKLDDNGEPLEPSEHEKMTPDEAYVKARQTGSDIFKGGLPKSKLWDINLVYEKQPRKPRIV